ncbi:MAG: HAD family phosphatase [Bryobacter sp.]|nr:HAD family phosphatase [Bryobacter sp.]
MQNFLAWIFDMDGVIVDSMPFHIRAWELYLEDKGIDPALLNRHMHGKHNDELIREFFGADLPASAVRLMGEEKEAVYRRLIQPELEGALVPGIRQVLSLQPQERKAVASNAEPRNVQFVLDEAGLGQHFGAVLDGYQVERGKPDPEIYLKAAQALNVEAQRCLVFEDSQTGINAALAAGMTVVAVNTHRAALAGMALEISHFEDDRLPAWLAQTSR